MSKVVKVFSVIGLSAFAVGITGGVILAKCFSDEHDECIDASLYITISSFYLSGLSFVAAGIRYITEDTNLNETSISNRLK